MTLAKAKLASSITFIVLASFMIVTYDIIQATGQIGWDLYYKRITIINDNSRVVSE
jgi:hypothetical protein